MTKVVERNKFASTWKEGLDAPFGGGPNTHDFFAGITRAPFAWQSLEQRFEMSFSPASSASRGTKRAARSDRRSAGPSRRREPSPQTIGR